MIFVINARCKHRHSLETPFGSNYFGHYSTTITRARNEKLQFLLNYIIIVIFLGLKTFKERNIDKGTL